MRILKRSLRRRSIGFAGYYYDMDDDGIECEGRVLERRTSKVIRWRTKAENGREALARCAAPDFKLLRPFYLEVLFGVVLLVGDVQLGSQLGEGAHRKPARSHMHARIVIGGRD